MWNTIPYMYRVVILVSFAYTYSDLYMHIDISVYLLVCMCLCMCAHERECNCARLCVTGYNTHICKLFYFCERWYGRLRRYLYRITERLKCNVRLENFIMMNSRSRIMFLMPQWATRVPFVVAIRFHSNVKIPWLESKTTSNFVYFLWFT